MKGSVLTVEQIDNNNIEKIKFNNEQNNQKETIESQNPYFIGSNNNINQNNNKNNSNIFGIDEDEIEEYEDGNNANKNNNKNIENNNERSIDRSSEEEKKENIQKNNDKNNEKKSKKSGKSDDDFEIGDLESLLT